MPNRKRTAPSNPLLRQEIVDGKGMLLTDATPLFPGAGGKPASYCLLWEWASNGLPLPAGGRVFLEVVRAGRRLWTSKGAILRFLEAQEEAVPEAPAPRKRRGQKPPPARDRSAECRAMGI